MSILNGYIASSDQPYGDPVTSSSPYYFTTTGDTLRLKSARNINSPTASGLPGEICWGSETVLGITTYYIYVCVAENNWRRTALSNLPI